MKSSLRVAVLLLSSAGVESIAGTVPPPATTPKVTPLPDNPCDVLTIQQVSTITGLDVTQARRWPSIYKFVQAQKEGREPGPGTICNYATRSDFGAISIALPPPAERSAARYWEARETYFRQFRGSAEAIPGIGKDAWISAGTTLHALARDDEQFSISTQMAQERSRRLVIKLARAILGRH